MRPIYCSFAMSAVSAVGCVCLLALFNAIFHSECIEGRVVRSGSNLFAIVIIFMIVAAIALVSNAAFLLRPRPSGAWPRFVEISLRCSVWKPLSLIIVSISKIFLRVVVFGNFGTDKSHADSCGLSAVYENQYHAATIMWDCAIFVTALSAICCDLELDFTPTLRRCAHIRLALCLVVDVIGSYVWGNGMAGQMSISLGPLKFLLDTQITSCITSQAVIALHLMFVSCRSRSGRGWAYGSLRFEFDECGRNSINREMMHIKREVHEAFAAINVPAIEAQSNDVQKMLVFDCSICHQLRQRLLQHQQKLLANCSVFLIPCRIADESGENVEFVLARPAFDVSWLRPLQRAADLHPVLYLNICFWVLVVPSILSAIFISVQFRGVVTFVLNFSAAIVLLGFLSSKRFNLDRVAVKHVASSFRFVVTVVLIVQGIALYVRRAILTATQGNSSYYQKTPWTPAAVAAGALCFCQCALLDCSPHFPAIGQTFVTVTALELALLTLVFNLHAGCVVHDIRISVHGGDAAFVCG